MDYLQYGDVLIVNKPEDNVLNLIINGLPSILERCKQENIYVYMF